MVKLTSYDGGYYVLEVTADGMHLCIGLRVAEIPVSEIMQKSRTETVLEVRTD